MNDYDLFVTAVLKNGVKPTSLRSVFPGRGRVPTKRRADVKRLFRPDGITDGIVFYDAKAGVFRAVQQPA